MNQIKMHILMTLVLSSILAGQVPDRIVVYKTIDSVQLGLHIFNPPGHQRSDKRPVIVFFHGGGWNNGAPKSMYRQCEYLASRGMVAISAQYRLRDSNGTTPRECVMDGKSAIRWVRQHAAELGIDPKKLAAGGGSAGGQVAAAAGTVKGFESTGEDMSISSRPCALVLYNPVIDNGPDGYGHTRVKEYWKEFSPMNNIDANTPPTVFMIGTRDDLVPVATAERYRDLMHTSGRRCDLFLYKDLKHGFYHREGFYETLLETDRFLESLGYLEGPPTLEKKTEAKPESK